MKNVQFGPHPPQKNFFYEIKAKCFNWNPIQKQRKIYENFLYGEK